jgi:hypothetical protein
LLSGKIKPGERARIQLENVKAAILEGIRTPSIKEMLEAAERRVAELEAARQVPPSRARSLFCPQ